MARIEKKFGKRLITVSTDFRPKSNMWGRFGGGWNWKLGFQAGGNTVIFNVLIGSIRISFTRENEHDKN